MCITIYIQKKILKIHMHSFINNNKVHIHVFPLRSSNIISWSPQKPSICMSWRKEFSLSWFWILNKWNIVHTPFICIFSHTVSLCYIPAHFFWSIFQFIFSFTMSKQLQNLSNESFILIIILFVSSKSSMSSRDISKLIF